MEQFKLWKMAVAFTTLEFILVIAKGLPSCMVETNSVVCRFEKETEEKEIEIKHFHSNDTDGTILLQCGLDRLKTCCTDNECSIVNINGTVNIMINIKDYSGKIGCFLLPSTTNSFNICNLTVTSPVSIISSTSADKPGTCEQRILDSIHHIQQQFWVVAVVVAVVAIIVTMVVALIKRRFKLFETANSSHQCSSVKRVKETQSSSSCMRLPNDSTKWLKCSGH